MFKIFQGLYEAHIVVAELYTSGSFYENVLGLTAAFKGDNVHFYWIDKSRKQMLGLWQYSEENFKEQHVGEPDVSRIAHAHFAFSVSQKDFFHIVQTLKEKDIRFESFFENTSEFIVHAWMPSVSAYFSDPDGHALEVIALLEDAPHPELGMIPWSQWESLHGRP